MQHSTILNPSGKYKPYIYKNDIRKFLSCDYDSANTIFEKIKEYERTVLNYEMFENRVPQELFHEFRLKRLPRSKERSG